MQQRASFWGLAVAAIVVTMAGCGSQRSQLVGTWISDSVPDRLPAGQSSPLDRSAAEEKNGATPPHSIQLRFYRSGRLDTVTQLPSIQTQKTGTWRFVSYDESKRMAIVEFELMQQRTRHEVEFLDRSTIRMIPPNMAGLSIRLEFKRK